MRARSGWEALPLAGRAVLLMVTGCPLFSIMGALVKLLGQRLGSSQIAFFRCFFGFIAILPFVLLTPGRHAFRTTHFCGHFLRGAVGVAGLARRDARLRRSANLFPTHQMRCATAGTAIG
jgi:drug/metabolite transporter (DMT)-like permease